MNSNMNNMAMSGMGMNNMGGTGGGAMGINGAMGNGSLGGMGAMNPMNLGMNSMGGSGMGMNMGMGNSGGNMGPSRAAAGINPSQLMGVGTGNGGMSLGGGVGVNSINPMGGMGGLNPTQLLQSQHQRDRDQISAMQQSHMQQQQRGGVSNMALGGGGYGMNNMNGMGALNNMGMGNSYGSINPSGMSSSPPASSPMGMGLMGEPPQRPGANMSLGNIGISGMSNMMGSQNHLGSQHPSNMHPHSSSMPHNPISHSSHPNHSSNSGGGPNIPPQMLHAMGISQERYQAMSSQERAMLAQKISIAYRNNANAVNNYSQQNSTLPSSSGTLGMSGQGNPSGSGMGYFDREGLQSRDQGRGFGEQQRSVMHGGLGLDSSGRPGSSAGLAGDMIGMGGGMNNMMPPPPRPSTSMSNRSASGIGMPPNMGMNNVGGMSLNTGMNGIGNMAGMVNMPALGNNMNNMNMASGLSRPGTATGMRSGGMSGVNMNTNQMGINMGINSINHSGMGGMNMPRNPSNLSSAGSAGSSGVPGSPGPNNIGMRPPSRAMSVSSAGGRNANDGPIINGYPMPPNTPKHPQTPGTPQMGHSLPQHQPTGGSSSLPQHSQYPQHMLQGSPPPVRSPSVAPGSPSLGGALPLRRGSPMSAQHTGVGLGTSTSGRGTPNPLKRKAESPKIGPPSGNSLHHSSPEVMDRPTSAMQNGINGKAPFNTMNIGMEMNRPGTASAFSPSTSGPAPGLRSQREGTPSSASMHGPTPSESLPSSNIFPHNDDLGSHGLPNPRTGSMPPSSTSTAPTESSGTTATSQAAAGLVSGNSLNGSVKVVPKLPPLPANVNLNPLVTEVKVVPVAGSDKTIPLLTAEEIGDIKRWHKVDSTYEEMYKAMRERMEVELKGDARAVPRDFLAVLDAGEFGNIGGKGGVLGNASIKWWEKGSYSVNPGARFRQRREGFDIRYPGKSRRDNHGRNKRGMKREGFKIPRRLGTEEANRPEQLVPIRLEFDVDHHKYRDTFVWNLNDPIITPEFFAQSVVEDYQLAPSYHSIIVKNIQEQLGDYKAHSALYDGEGGDYLGDDHDPSITENGTLNEEDAMWWESWRKRLRTEYGFVKAGKGSKGKRKRKVAGSKDESPEDADIEDTADHDTLLDERPMTVEEFEIDEGKMTEDMRIVIKLDIIVGSMKLDDQFEWDIDNYKASPEQFAEIYTQDLGLSGEFRSAIAHSIREQVQTYHKSLFLIGRPSDGSSIQDEELRSAFLPSLAEGARLMEQVQSFTPLLNYLSDGEIERNEKERDKDVNRRRKRNTRGRRGVNLPDREPIRTYRTPAIGFPELDAATLALAAAANAPVSRRAAAAAASLTIANMVASENGTPFTPLSAPAVPQPTATAVVREKKVKGLFKTPQIPPSVFRPRAKVTAPTPSTAADISSLPAPLENDPPPSINTPDRRFLRPLLARKSKDTEREAKEKEYAEGQHANYIEGIWHCSNCGCPETIAIGRRKGPLGNKSQCGDCGRFWHRHRRPRPCTYNIDEEYHSNLTKKKGSAATLRAQDRSVSIPADDSSAPPTPMRDRKKERSEAPSRLSPPASRRALREEDRAVSPISSSSSASEPPLSQRVKLTNGTTASPRNSPSPSRAIKSADKGESRNSKDLVTKNELSPSTPPRNTAQSPPTTPAKTWPPPWLTTTMHSTQTKYPNDKFDVVWRKVGEGSEWRIKCVDCPGKLYKPGPGETLSNFEVHLKNRQHRQRVDDRIGK